MRRIGPFLRDAWHLARPYWSSEDRWKARGLLAVVVALNLSLVGMTVLLTYWQRAFYNALEAKDWDAFIALLFTWHTTEAEGFLPSFAIVAALYILIAVYQLYLRQALQIRWRRWLTEIYLTQWLDGRAYYRMALTDPVTDNPDQRIAEDARMFVDDTLSLGLGLMNSVVTLFSFILVLWSLSGPLNVLGVEIPGYMVWVALIYAVIGTWLAHLIGRPLVALNFTQQKVEADFRYALVRFRENAEGIALYGGEADEKRGLTQRFRALMENWWSIMTATKRLTFFTAGYTQVAVIFPIVVAAPAYFAGRIQLGGLIQTSSAFGQVQGALSWFVDNYARLTEWRATVERLTGFTRGVTAAAAAHTGPVAAKGTDTGLGIANVTLALPDGRVLLDQASARIEPGEAVLLTGPSGSGKSTLFRAIAGIWPFGGGRVDLPATGRALFLPQRPYIPLGSLKRAVCYPDDEAAFTDEAVTEALEAAELAHLVQRLHEADSWDKRLSGGEQQRIALARALLLKPDWLFLDEATASLDPGAEERLYTRLKERLPGSTILSIAHRPAVAAFHDRTLRLEEKRLVA
ncbi:ABC transporter ATP-binding protein/permease [Neoroseomonas oryzicola]|uniref:ABC transporter ATP-binding protein/permease n=1 Tax=Neoroseomonas oryzicola TaxID=535904 RepID=A0A9X9WCM4_9PROT|nr:ABC transporter ATP-binding protein/permease [Neoroseomonas oryzicola]MBR0658084.1 ABC transporter ATP-binding protein/permease [Neoroseomonas oryzicola]NKE15387.1 ABC transporter ATP-binding protein/permease [Neoroseomonas oryzicola]